ncbi:DEAD/DEAH box helicase [Lelliottia sp. V89_10]|uniref:DEAD/DEAH box helicase n=1 Tax=Lelliottia wanjuensis TaxID=3050585 RepID=UPI00249F0686|nr:MULTISPECIES: DEAD/DEAH box helicase [unclassified Lelliottia]MDI3359343.1 DEAD/DEAH box helicase [Lelliottia sp. V89_13]MDK9549975.1 DEAD/DEAH box helicase [Lelliottia sp. V89_5]MDK9596361.1 DEAD/DEAH box helicase [Lelliottia sp. V89_10]
MNKILRIKNDNFSKLSIEKLIEDLHVNGPISSNVIEDLTYYKIFHSEEFLKHEEKIIIELGLFYKNKEPDDLLSFILSGIGKKNNSLFGEFLTPVQASIRLAIEDDQYVSISAPTSAGKSYSIKDYISKLNGDVVIIVPSRALIAEYINNLKEKFGLSKNIMISSFADLIFKNRKNLRRIFVLTPERARDLFPIKDSLNVELVFFDEAQVCEEKERGVTFDALIRRIKINFSAAKLVFAHPFVENPGAQMLKHDLDSNKSYFRAYPHNTVGKAFVFRHSNGKDYFFSPFKDKGYLLSESVLLDKDFESFAFDGTKSVLIFVSKSSLYNGKFREGFNKHINKFPLIKSNKALNIINKVETLLGANNSGHSSTLVNLLKVGVVIHHGSVPLEVRFLIEDFIREGFSKICFATSTLAQGINMPFDIVWLANMRISAESDEERALAFKNLIGRSGRLTSNNVFDFGYVYTKNPKLLSERIQSPYILSERSILHDVLDDETNDMHEFVSSIFDGTFNEDYNIPLSRIKRISDEQVLACIKNALSIIFLGNNGESLRGQSNRANRIKLQEYLKYAFESYIGRPLFKGESNVFDNAIKILIYVIQGKSFKEIVGMRYSFASNRDDNRQGLVPFMQPASKIPDATLENAYPMFFNVKAKDVSYDRIVFDTYDYLDTVISYSLTDAFMGALRVYYGKVKDNNALKMMDLLKYGTINPIHTLLLRYGFLSEDLEMIEGYVKNINESEIVFETSEDMSAEMIKKIEWYLPED